MKNVDYRYIFFPQFTIRLTLKEKEQNKIQNNIFHTRTNKKTSVSPHQEACPSHAFNSIHPTNNGIPGKAKAKLHTPLLVLEARERNSTHEWHLILQFSFTELVPLGMGLPLRPTTHSINNEIELTIHFLGNLVSLPPPPLKAHYLSVSRCPSTGRPLLWCTPQNDEKWTSIATTRNICPASQSASFIIRYHQAVRSEWPASLKRCHSVSSTTMMMITKCGGDSL